MSKLGQGVENWECALTVRLIQRLILPIKIDEFFPQISIIQYAPSHAFTTFLHRQITQPALLLEAPIAQ